jgi:hypothetical protein
MNELTVILKDSARTYKQTFPIYEVFTVSVDDPIVLRCIDYAKQNFQGEPERIQVRIDMEIQ